MMGPLLELGCRRPKQLSASLLQKSNSTLQLTSNISPILLNRTLRKQRPAIFLPAERLAKRLLSLSADRQVWLLSEPVPMQIGREAKKVTKADEKPIA